MDKIDKPTSEAKARVTAVYDNAAVGIHSCIEDIRQIIDSGRKAAYLSVNAVMVQTYWNIGRRIVEEEQNGKERADYGEFLITTLADSLTHTFGNTFSKRNLQYFRKFYQLFPDFEIVNTRVHNLTWSHYRRLLTVHESDARYWYLNEANEQMWSVRTLDRNVSTQYYHRLMQSPKKEKVIAEMQHKTAEFQKSKFELIKNPVVAEFLGFSSTDYSETDLEKAIITHLRDFLMELGRGFAFVARQQHIVTETDDNPTIGIVLCSETDKDIARYSILHDSNQIFMAKYMTYMPTEEELRAEIETQKRMFYLQQKERQ